MHELGIAHGHGGSSEAPGSIGKKTPLSFKVSLSCSRETFACTRQSKSASLIGAISYP